MDAYVNYLETNTLTYFYGIPQHSNAHAKKVQLLTN